MENLKKTPLYDRHIEAGAKMSPFGGFDMPIEYSGIVSEHEAVRKQVGVFDVSHMGKSWWRGRRPCALSIIYSRTMSAI